MIRGKADCNSVNMLPDNFIVFVPHLLCGALGLGITLALIPFLRRSTAALVVRAPGRTFHHTHISPISRFGGIALAAAFLAVTTVVFIWFPVEQELMLRRIVIACGSLAMFLLGLLDDIRPLGARKKLAGQVSIAFAVCAFGVSIEELQNPFTGEIYQLGYLGWVLTVIWLVALTNMMNLIDGIDGLAGGVAMMMMGLLVYVGTNGGSRYAILIAAGMFGALLGFLRYNFPPAKIYMGDGGAYLLGFLIGVLTIVNSQKGTIMAALVAPLFALALPIVDVCIAILRRGLRGLPLFRPDRRHLHHKLMQIGLSRTRTVLILYGISSVFLLMAFGVFWSQGKWVPILFGFMCLTLLLSARTFNFSRDWFAVGRVLENSLELRKETHYALALGRWLELEAERSPAIENLWLDFTFVARKLGFSSVRLTLDDGVRAWVSPNLPMGENLLHESHDFSAGHATVLEFTADASVISDRLFDYLGELASEAWLKAASRWHAVNQLPVRFDARVENPPAPPKGAPPPKSTATEARSV